MQDHALVKAATGLEGGCVARGSTCGIVSTGALSLALTHEAEIQAGGWAAEAAVLARAGDFVRWFEAVYGTSLCRDHTRADFYTIRGQLKYFLTFYRLMGCFRRIRGAMRHHYENPSRLDGAPLNGIEGSQEQPLHCAQYVLGKIRDQTGVGNRRMERISFVLDGGVGLSGGLCGALAGAVIGINILFGLPVRDQSFWKNAADFAVGHVNLVAETSLGPKEPFRIGKQVIREFQTLSESVACRDITGRRFASPLEFQEYIRSSQRCRGLMDRMAETAARLIRHYRGDESTQS